MIPLSVAPFFLALGLPLHASPVTQTCSSNPLPYDAVVLGTNEIIELMPATTGLSIPVSTLANVDVESCGSSEVCIEEIVTGSASRVVSSVVAKFNKLPASIVTAIEDVVDAIEAGVEPGKASGNTINGGLLVSPTADSTRQSGTSDSVSASQGSSGRSALSSGTLPVQNTTPGLMTGTWLSATTSTYYPGQSATKPVKNSSKGPKSSAETYDINSTVKGSLSSTDQGQGGSNITGSGRLIAPIPTSQITYVLKVTNSQGSVTDEVLEVGYHSGLPSTNLLFAYADSVTTTETSIPTGVSIQTISTSTCTTAGAVISATSSGDTVTTTVPELCVDGLAFRIFGLPGFHSSSDLPSLCHKAFSFILGIVWRLLCPPGLPPTFSITSVDPEKMPPGDNPKDGNPDDQEPTATERLNPTARSKFHSSAVATSSRRTRRTVPSSAVATSSRTTRSTLSSSAAATAIRYVVMPLIETPQSAIESVFAPYALRANVTQVRTTDGLAKRSNGQAKRSDGTLEFFALELSDSEASTIDANTDFVIMQESSFDIEMPDSGQEDPDLNGATYASEPLDSNPNVGSMGLRHKGQRSKGSSLFKRIPLQSWAQKMTSWSLAMISLVPGLPLPNYEQADDDIYPYYFVDPIEPVATVRVYDIE